MVLHPRICERIAANVALVRRLGGAKDASKWCPNDLGTWLSQTMIKYWRSLGEDRGTLIPHSLNG